MGFIAADRGQRRLFGYSLDDFVGADAKSRFVVGIVKELDLSELYADYSDQGADAYDPQTLLATWFFAYSEGTRSTRRLEDLCRRDMHYIYVSADLSPDHCTLSRFRKRHAERLPGLFMEIIRLAAHRGVSEFRRISTDGSKIEAVASFRQGRSGEQLESELRRVREQIECYLAQSALLDEEEDEEAPALDEVRLRLQKLKAMEQRLVERQGQLAERKKALQSKDRPKHQINLVEPEARNMNQVNGRRAAPAYNAQLSVDAESQLIVAAEVTDEPNDRRQFAGQHALVEKNLGADPKRQYTADSGYHSLQQLEYVEKEQVDAVIADPRPEDRAGQKAAEAEPEQSEKPFKRSDFAYDGKADRYECPAGRPLTYWYTDTKRGRRTRIYRAEGCAGCRLRDRCMKGCKADSDRQITRDESEPLAEAMAQKAHGPDGRKRLKERAMTVEPVIGNLKWNLGFHRFRLRGKAKAGAEFLLMCIGHNLGKLHKLMGTLERAEAAALAITASALSSFLRFLKAMIHQRRPTPPLPAAHPL